jgi:hypothetical protein
LLLNFRRQAVRHVHLFLGRFLQPPSEQPLQWLKENY